MCPAGCWHGRAFSNGAQGLSLARVFTCIEVHVREAQAGPQRRRRVMSEQPSQPGKRGQTMTVPRVGYSNECQSGSEGDPFLAGGRPGPAARKRELERQRRNLVSTRFLELDRILSLSGDSDAKPQVQQGARRIDKEAILKDAASRITTQSSELSKAYQRLAFMTKEVENLRAEKVDLRADKSYLHSELTAIRPEVQRLRSDNIHLWQAIRGSGGLKSVFNADVAKIPADLLLRAHCSHAATVNAEESLGDVVAGNGLHDADVGLGGEQVASLVAVPQEKGIQRELAGQQSPPSRMLMPAPKRRRSSFESHMLDTVPDAQNPTGNRDSQPASFTDGRAVEKICPGEIAASRAGAESGSLVDSFLVFQTPEELGGLFAGLPHQLGPSNPAERPRPLISSASGQTIEGEAATSPIQPSTHNPESGPVISPSIGNRSVDPRHGSQATTALKAVPENASGSAVEKLVQEGNADADTSDDFFADIAYCA